MYTVMSNCELAHRYDSGSRKRERRRGRKREGKRRRWKRGGRARRTPTIRREDTAKVTVARAPSIDDDSNHDNGDDDDDNEDDRRRELRAHPRLRCPSGGGGASRRGSPTRQRGSSVRWNRETAASERESREEIVQREGTGGESGRRYK